MTKSPCSTRRSTTATHLGETLIAAGFTPKFREYRLNPETVETVGDDVDVVCVFVNDKVTREVIEVLAAKGVKMIALRCAGFNGVDLQAAADHGLLVARACPRTPRTRWPSTRSPSRSR